MTAPQTAARPARLSRTLARSLRFPALGLCALGLSAGMASAQDATASLFDAKGDPVGTAAFTQTAAGVLIDLELTGMQPGEHALHIHETGACAPDFKAAGGHLGHEDAPHGYLTEGGPHAGDLPNIHVPDNGALRVEILAPLVSIDAAAAANADDPAAGVLGKAAEALIPGAPRAPLSLLDDDGAALVIHEGPDDYASGPAGKAGPRIACGVIEGL